MNGSLAMLQMKGDYILEMNGSLVMLPMKGDYILEMNGSLVMFQYAISYHPKHHQIAVLL
jgi:hypothetical protein